MLKIGLTGGIGSGKSRVADLFETWGATLVDTDVIAHELTAPGGRAIPALQAQFGAAAITAEGALNRPVIREQVFAKPSARQALENILHPLISEVALEQGHQATGHYIVYVIPLLVESGRWVDRVDRICVVDCDPETQIQRVKQRSKLTRVAIERIMAVQASRSERLAMANDVIINDAQTSIADLECQALALHHQLCQLAQQK